MNKLNIGSGNVGGSIFAKDWINIDINFNPSNADFKDGATYQCFDLCGDWLIDSNSVDCIFASHIFEHIIYDKLLHVAKECYRVLKPGMPIRIICPDPRAFVSNWQIRNKQYLLDCFGQDYYTQFGYENNLSAGFTDMFFHDHIDHYLCSSLDLLMIMFIKAGFSKVNEMRYGNTAFPEYFGDVTTTIDNRPVMSFYLECVK